MFIDRSDAGKQLAARFMDYQGVNALVLAIPRGGVPVAVEVAKRLKAEFSLVITRKLPYPNNPEAGFGAIAEDSSIFILQSAVKALPLQLIETIIASQSKEIKRRINVLRQGTPLPKIEDRVVILIDDGIAMGSTMRASIKLVQRRNPEKLIVSAPVSSPELARALEQREAVDKVIVLEQPRFFRAVAQVYQNWYDVPDHEVLEIMKNWDHHHADREEPVKKKEQDGSF